jgi:hypothetical protein
MQGIKFELAWFLFSLASSIVIRFKLKHDPEKMALGKTPRVSWRLSMQPHISCVMGNAPGKWRISQCNSK